MPPTTLQAVTGLSATQENPGGIAQKIYVANAADMTTIQQPSDLAAAATNAAAALISANHVFATGKQFHEFYCTQNKGELNMDNAAEIDASGGFMKVKVFVPGYDPSNFGTLRMAKGGNFVVLVPMADGSIAQLGTSLFPAKLLNFKFMSAQQGSGVRGVELEFQAFQMAPYKYTGTIQLTPAP